LAKVFVATYQGISGAGKDALMSFIKECKNTSEHIQNVSLLNILGKNPVISDELNPYFGNVIPAIGNLNSCGDSAEETKLKLETRKILNIPDMQIFVTSVRVPVINAHSEVVFVEFECEIEYQEIVSSLQSAEGIEFVEPYPTPIYVTGRRKVYVGRIRQDTENKKIYQFFIVADNLRKGAATNALQIAEEIAKRKSV
jgi:aspartate-semialdehyde dehydrogenase